MKEREGETKELLGGREGRKNEREREAGRKKRNEGEEKERGE